MKRTTLLELECQLDEIQKLLDLGLSEEHIARSLGLPTDALALIGNRFHESLSREHDAVAGMQFDGSTITTTRTLSDGTVVEIARHFKPPPTKTTRELPVSPIKMKTLTGKR